MSTVVEEAAAAYAKAVSQLKDAEFHHRFVQNIRLEVQAEMMQAADEEISAQSDVGKKRRAVEEAKDFVTAKRREAFKAQVQAKGLYTPADGLVLSRRFGFEFNEQDNIVSHSPVHSPPASP
jgi:ATPase subunit of ABC transporter with duplicated ATPase domains